MSGAQVCSHGRQGSLVTAITQDTRHTATCCSVSALWFFPLSQVGRWPRLRPAARVLMRFFPRLPSPIFRGDAANLSWSQRSSLILDVSRSLCGLCKAADVQRRDRLHLDLPPGPLPLGPPLFFLGPAPPRTAAARTALHPDRSHPSPGCCAFVLLLCALFCALLCCALWCAQCCAGVFKVHQPETSVENLNRVPNLSGPKPKKHQVVKKNWWLEKIPGLKKPSCVEKPSWSWKKQRLKKKLQS